MLYSVWYTKDAHCWDTYIIPVDEITTTTLICFEWWAIVHLEYDNPVLKFLGENRSTYPWLDEREETVIIN